MRCARTARGARMNRRSLFGIVKAAGSGVSLISWPSTPNGPCVSECRECLDTLAESLNRTNAGHHVVTVYLDIAETRDTACAAGIPPAE